MHLEAVHAINRANHRHDRLSLDCLGPNSPRFYEIHVFLLHHDKAGACPVQVKPLLLPLPLALLPFRALRCSSGLSL